MSKNISFTAEAVAYMRYLNGDKYSKPFVSTKTRILFNLSKFISPNFVQNIVKRRIQLSNKIDCLIKKENPSQIIELASGYSTRGVRTTKNSKTRYIEIDLPEIIINKKDKLEEKIPENLVFLSFDVTKEDIYSKLKEYIEDKKTVIFSEGLNSYLTKEQHDLLTKRIANLIFKLKKSKYISNDVFSEGKKKIFDGRFGRIFSFLFTKKTGSKADQHFKTEKECINYFRNFGLRCKIIENDAYFLYEVTK